MQEEWRDIAGYEGLYRVSNFGRIKSLDRKQIYSNGDIHYYKGKMLKPSRAIGGYLKIRLGSTGREAGVHRFVAETFVPNPKGYPEVNHIDGDKHNNRADNLEWCDRRANMAHCHNVLGKPTGKTKTPVICIDTGEVFDSLSTASKEKHINLGHLCEAVNGKRHKCGGYHWAKVG